MKPIYLSLDPKVPAHSYWDQTLLDDVLAMVPRGDRQIIVIPGAYQADLVDDISLELAPYDKVLVIITSDEESNFPVDKLFHPDMVIYVTYPQAKHRSVDRYFPIGYAKDTRELIKENGNSAKSLDWFFAGQANHASREDCITHLEGLPGGRLFVSGGFAQGLDYREYMQFMARAKVVPAPAGNISPDSFRLYEALEAGAIPIVENRPFWAMLFGDVPFPVVDDWSHLSDLIENLKDRPALNNRCQAWWQQRKRLLASQLKDDTDAPENSPITVLIPCSPIPSHPETYILDETIASVRAHLPDSEIVLMFDGIRPEQEDKRENYEEFMRRALWKASNEWSNILPLIFEAHTHQASMTREALRGVRTPQILFVESDTPLTPDRAIPWPELVGAIASGHANVIRFHHEALILDVHKHLMLDNEPQMVAGAPLMRTVQWSQRPHLASADFYRGMLDSYFTPQARTFIEDRMHGIVENAYLTRGVAGWTDFKLWMFTPEGDIKRSFHTDGRAGETKYDQDLVF